MKWLGCDQEKDAEDCLEEIEKSNIREIDWIIVDHYGLDEPWEKKLKSKLRVEKKPNILVIDDLANRRHEADIIVDQNYFGPTGNERYRGLIPETCRQLLGPNYALLSDEYKQMHKLAPRRNEIKRILVYFGGVDKNNLTQKTMECLSEPQFREIAVDVMMGKLTTRSRKVYELARRRGNTTLHEPAPSLSGLIMRADLAIGAAGTTTWERACLRLPSILISTAENQEEFAKALHKEGHIKLIGRGDQISKDKIKEAILDIRENGNLIDGGWHLTDGYGAQRVSRMVIRKGERIKLQRSQDEENFRIKKRPLRMKEDAKLNMKRN